jgi:trimeric autotransporter adhesin
MATVVKDFKIKSGLVVQGTTGTINGFDILTKKEDDLDFIVDLIGGETLVKSVSSEFDVSEAGELSLDRTVVDTYYDAAGSADAAEAAAIAEAASDATSKADAAQAAAEAFATSADETLYGTVTTDIATAKSEAISSAEEYTDTREAAITTAYESYADAAEASAKEYTDTREAAITTAYEAYADQAELDAISSANSYTDTEISNLVG